ncbi:MAG: 50S ribosomal protein L6 [Cryomorphaceae bacterium]|nr:MAG: 50S ribosomal protein L6 [Cryomorphaceae bacterium]
MSRIGKAIINLPGGVELKVSDDNVVTVKGPKGELSQPLADNLSVKIEEGVVTVERANEEKSTRSQHGLTRALLNNMVEGVSNGFIIKQELVGVGYRAKTTGQLLELSLGYSHPIVFEIPSEVKVEAVTEKGKNPVITLESHDKQLVGMVAAKIRSFRKPEPYKGKGIRYVGEQLRRKAGKSASK